MAVYPRLTVLPIGQGSCNLVEVYDRPFSGNIPQGNLIYLAMVDCGTSHGMADPWSDPKYSHIAASLDYVIERMEERADYLGVPDYYLDSFDLTHQDADHWNLFTPLIWNLFHINNNAIELVNGNLHSQIQYFNHDRSTLQIIHKNNIINNTPMVSHSLCGTYKGDNSWDFLVRASSQVYPDEPIYEIELNPLTISNKDNRVYVKMRKLGNNSNTGIAYIIMVEYQGYTHTITFLLLNQINQKEYNIFWNIELEDKIYEVMYSKPIKTLQMNIGINLQQNVNLFRQMLEQIYMRYFNIRGEILSSNRPLCIDLNVPMDIWKELSNILIYTNFTNLQLDNYFQIDNLRLNPAVLIQPFIGSSSRAGLYYKGNANNFLDFLEACSCNPVFDYSNENTQQITLIQNHHFYLQPHEVERYMLSNLNRDNILKYNKDFKNQNTVDSGYFRNASGSIFVLKINVGLNNSVSYLFTGDATIHSMFSATIALEGINWINGCIMTAPHHGSQHTNYVLKKLLDGSIRRDWAKFDTFLRKLGSEAMVISAGQLSEYGHPGSHFIEHSIKFFIGQKPEHTITICENPEMPKNDRKFYIKKINNNIFTTVVGKDPVRYLTKADETNTKYVAHRFNGNNHEEVSL